MDKSENDKLIKVITPDIGDFKDVPIIELLIKDGDIVEIDQPLITIESDKATMEIPSTHSGVVKKFLLKLEIKYQKVRRFAIYKPRT